MKTAVNALFLVLLLAAAPLASAQPDDASSALREPELSVQSVLDELGSAAIRLPLATALGAVLALRPRRAGTPKRSASVVQTQIVLAIVGAVIMLVVGASLARAFGIVGVASLIRYRSKINDPKDAVVMLAALSVGLAAGVGLYALAVFATLFLVVLLWVIESFEPHRRAFELSIKLGDQTEALRPRIEAVLRRNKARYEVRTVSGGEVAYMLSAPFSFDTDRASKSLVELDPDGKGAVEWKEIKPKESK